MHMISKKDVNPAELDTVRESRNPTTFNTANGEVQTNEEATVHVYDLDLFVTLQIPEDTRRIMDIPKSGPVVKTHISLQTGAIQDNTENYVPIALTHTIAKNA